MEIQDIFVKHERGRKPHLSINHPLNPSPQPTISTHPIRYNLEDSVFYIWAKDLKTHFDEQYKVQVLPELLAAIAAAGGSGVEEDDVENDGNKASGEEALGHGVEMRGEVDEQIHAGGR